MGFHGVENSFCCSIKLNERLFSSLSLSPSSVYEPHAFLLDEECSSMLPVTAAGLGSILFSIPVDVEYLNSTHRTVDVPAVAPKLKPTIQATPLTTPTMVDRLKDVGRCGHHCVIR